jgi:hypothetical protein
LRPAKGVIDLRVLIAQFSRRDLGIVIPSEYLEVVIKRA